MNKGIINSSLKTRLLKVKCPIICRQKFLYLFVSRLVRVKRWNPKIFSIHSYFIYCSFFFFFFFFVFCCICHFRFGLWQVELVRTKSSNCIPIFNYKIYKPYFMVLTFCSDMQFSTRDSDNDLKPEGRQLCSAVQRRLVLQSLSSFQSKRFVSKRKSPLTCYWCQLVTF